MKWNEGIWGTYEDEDNSAVVFGHWEAAGRFKMWRSNLKGISLGLELQTSLKRKFYICHKSTPKDALNVWFHEKDVNDCVDLRENLKQHRVLQSKSRSVWHFFT